jgi:hypothetical protein
VSAAKFQLVGTREMVARIEEVAHKARRAIDKAVYKFGNTEMREMKRLVPVDTGTLKNSGYVEKPKRDGSRVMLEIGFGGAAEHYAMYVHEDLDAYHENGQAKYVEMPLSESAPFFAQRVGEDVRKELGL